ncbi:MAG TPA: cytochrome ubiquinol oxidase subunit I [Desulfomonilaceae bacterium]|nr:cytochrome ubiquinol oxidase subunit I [Desulfomonilaceae bacterium]
MDPVTLSRLQFAVATYFHFLFVPLTLGLSVLVAIMETQYVRTRDEEYKKMTKFWGKLFVINFALGVVTGITLEFQFGTNWSRYSKYVGDIFGSLLAIEATTSFFLESTFIGIWLFGWKRLSPKAHAVCIWLVAVASNLSAYWILSANSWMQHPVGYVIRNGRAELNDFWAVVAQPYAIFMYLHVISAAYILAGFFVLGISAYHILRKNNIPFFKRSFRMAAVFAVIFSIAELGIGDLHGKQMMKAQPAKAAAAESVWETTKGAPMYLLVIPDEANERNKLELFGIPKLLSWVALGDKDGVYKGLKEWPREERPPVALTFWTFRLMVGLGMLFILLSCLAWWKRKDPESAPMLLKVLVLAMPLPYLALEFGWTVTELGRQPWIVYGVMKTSDAVSRLAVSQVGLSLAAFILFYTVLGIVCFYLIAKYARKVPEPAPQVGQEPQAATAGN